MITATETNKQDVRKCAACQHYAYYRCSVDGHYIGYPYRDTPTKCRSYKPHKDYKRGSESSEGELKKEINRNENP